MRPRIELIVSGNTSGTTTVGGTLDLYGDEEITINYSVKDVRDVASTNATYSQNFQIPGTKNNNQIFDNLFLVGADGKFDPRKKAPAYILADSEVVAEGYLQVVSIDVEDRDKPVYSVTMFGNTKGFNSAIKGKYLTDYNWSALNHTLSVANIVNSWSANTSTLGYYYSIKDYGYDYTLNGVKGSQQGSTYKQGIPIGNMFPDFSNKYVLDNIFAEAGYTYESNFLSSATFNQTIMPYNRDPNSIMGSDFLSARTFIATNTSLSATPLSSGWTISPYAIQPYTYDYEYRLRANTIQSGSSGSSLYTQNITGDTYTFDQPMISSFAFGVNYSHTPLTNQQRFQIGCRFYRSSFLGGSIPFHEELSLNEVQTSEGFYLFQTPVCDDTTQAWVAGTAYKPFEQGEKVWVSLFARVNLGYVAPVMSQVPFNIIAGGIYWKHFPSAQRTSGQVVDMNNVIPEKVLATDYLKSIFTMFNCYIEPSKTVPNRFIIEPFEDYFAAGSERNWSTKLDRSQKITETLISEELAKQYRFTYKEDKDFLNEEYKNSQKEVYGELVYDVDNQFTTNDEEITCIFSPTPCDNLFGSNQFVIPKMGKYDSNGRYGKTNFNHRFLRKNSTLTKLPSGEFFRFTGATTYSSYPYAGHLDHPFTGTTDYNWGSVSKVFYPWNLVTNNAITENNLVNMYWKKYLDEVTDKEAKLITAYFKLTPLDIAQFRFADKVYVEGLTSEGGHFYRVNSISYSLNSDKPAKIELLKILTKYTAKFKSRKLIPWGTSVGIGIGPGSGFQMGSTKVLKPNSIGIGEGTVINSSNVFALGSGNLIAGNNDNSLIIGESNILSPSSTGTTILGFGNTVEYNSNDTTIIGNYNSVLSGSSNVYLKGNNNYVKFGDKINIEGYDNYVNVNLASGLSSGVNIYGNGNVTYGLATGVTIDGNLNFISGNTVNLRVNGDSNSASTLSSGLTINGDYNVVSSSVNNIVINGSSNYVPLSGRNITILGMNSIQAISSDTVYTPSVSVNNTFILSTGSTIEMGGGVVAGTLGTALGSGVTVDSEASFGTGIGKFTEVTMVGEFAMASQGNYGQAGTVMLQNRTTGATAAELFTDILSTQRFTIPSGSSYYVRLYAAGTDQTTHDSIAYRGEGLIKNKSGTTTLTETILMSVVSYDSYISATTLTVSANTTNDSLTVTASGQTGSIMNWICQVDYTKINQFI